MINQPIYKNSRKIVCMLFVFFLMFTIAPKNNIRVHAIANMSQVNYEKNGGEWTGETPDGVYFWNSQDVQLPTSSAISKAGYAFNGWYDNQELTGEPITSISTVTNEDKPYTFYASWTRVPDLYYSMYGGSVEYRKYECSIYTDSSKETYYTGNSGKWNIEYKVGENEGMHLSLNGFEENNTLLSIGRNGYIDIASNNVISNQNSGSLIIDANTVFMGNGTLTLQASESALSVNADVLVDGPTIVINSQDSSLPVIGNNGNIKLKNGTIKVNNNSYSTESDKLYLVKNDNKNYAMYVDENYQIEYVNGKDESWSIIESEDKGQKYVSLIIIDDLNKNIVFDNKNKEYILALSINGNSKTLGSLDATNSVVTVQSTGEKTFTINGNVIAQSFYMAQCNSLNLNLVNGIVITTEKEGVTNNVSVTSSKLNIKNGSIINTKGVISLVNADITIGENEEQSPSSCGIRANSIIVDSSNLDISDVVNGIELIDPIQADNDGSMLTLCNNASLIIDASEVGVQGSYGLGGYFYNNILVKDTSSLTIKGGSKAIASAVVSEVPTNKAVRSVDNKTVYFNINDDENYTTDYYYADTTTVAKKLTILDKMPMLINNESDDFEVKVSSEKGYKEFTKGKTSLSTIHIDGLTLADIYHAAEGVNSGIIVMKDNAVLSEGTDYTVSDGSIKVSLSKKYLDKLDVGTHTINVYVGKTSIPTSTNNDYSFVVNVKINKPEINNPIYHVVKTGVE